MSAKDWGWASSPAFGLPPHTDARPIIRQRTIQAISALPSAECPLSLREIAKRIRHEDDDSVLASLLRMYAQSLDVSYGLDYS